MTDHPRQQLQHIIARYGRSICDDPKRCEALLRDLCPDSRRETNMLTLALREGVVQELLGIAKSALPPEVLMLQQAQALHDSMGMAEALALWTVESWAMALGIPVVAVPVLKSPAQPPATPPAALQTPAQLLQLAKQRLEQAKLDQLQAKQVQQQAQRQLEIEAAWRSNTKIGRHGEHLPVTAASWAAVLDAKTGLMWAVNPAMGDGFPNPIEKMRWDDAMAWPEAVNAVGWCGHHDWRLPTVGELKTLLITEKQQGLHIRRAIFPDIPSGTYWVWTSSPYANNGNYAWIVFFGYGDTNDVNKNSSYYVRVVRSGQ